MVGLISGIEEKLIDFRNIVFIPAVAKRKRAPMVADLEYYIQKFPYCRMWVLTSGTRVTISEVRERMLTTHRRVCTLDAAPYFTKISEPVAIVLNRQRGKLIEKPRIRRIMSVAGQRYAYGVGARDDE